MVFAQRSTHYTLPLLFDKQANIHSRISNFDFRDRDPVQKDPNLWIIAKCAIVKYIYKGRPKEERYDHRTASLFWGAVLEREDEPRDETEEEENWVDTESLAIGWKQTGKETDGRKGAPNKSDEANDETRDEILANEGTDESAYGQGEDAITKQTHGLEEGHGTT